MDGIKSPGSVDEYDSWDGRRFEAKYRDWKGVNCGRCLKNPHSPNGKFAALAVEEHR